MREKIVLLACLALFIVPQCKNRNGELMTVNGPISSDQMGVTLVHEHVLVDFIGADSITESRWEKAEVTEKVLPYLIQIRDLGCKTLVECTPEYIGKDTRLLKILSDSSGMNIITNTGYYGASNDKYMPKHAYYETADQLAARWICESENGINGTGIKPGFIKIGVGSGKLSELHKKIVTAAARTHLKTGLTIASHTGPAIPAFEQLEILQKEGVSPEAFIWVHAQSEKDLLNHVKAAKMGTWIGFDGVNDNNVEEYLKMIINMKENKLMDKILLSHDAGWYSPGAENGGKFRAYTTIFEKLLPLLKSANFTEEEIQQIMVSNPAKAFTIHIRTIK